MSNFLCPQVKLGLQSGDYQLQSVLFCIIPTVYRGVYSQPLNAVFSQCCGICMSLCVFVYTVYCIYFLCELES